MVLNRGKLIVLLETHLLIIGRDEVSTVMTPGLSRALSRSQWVDLLCVYETSVWLEPNFGPKFGSRQTETFYSRNRDTW